MAGILKQVVLLSLPAHDALKRSAEKIRREFADILLRLLSRRKTRAGSDAPDICRIRPDALEEFPQQEGDLRGLGSGIGVDFIEHDELQVTSMEERCVFWKEQEVLQHGVVRHQHMRRAGQHFIAGQKPVRRNICPAHAVRRGGPEKRVAHDSGLLVLPLGTPGRETGVTPHGDALSAKRSGEQRNEPLIKLVIRQRVQRVNQYNPNSRFVALSLRLSEQGIEDGIQETLSFSTAGAGGHDGVFPVSNDGLQRLLLMRVQRTIIDSAVESFEITVQ